MNKIMIFFVMAAICSCSGYIPKPQGYMRFDLPEKKYKLFDTVCPYKFEIPVYSQMIPNSEGEFWYNLYFPNYATTLYLSYKSIKNHPLDKLLEDTHEFIYKHSSKADAINDQFIENETNAGLLVELGGNSATPLQFFVTDSVRHFLRGSLYFYSAPNRDSLLPLINFFREDIEHLLETIEFKDFKLP